MQFSARLSTHDRSPTLNMCDADLLGTRITQGDLSMHISRGYYGQRLVGRGEAERLLRGSSIINMVGTETVSMSIGMGIGSRDGIKTISGVPFLIVFKV